MSSNARSRILTATLAIAAGGGLMAASLSSASAEQGWPNHFQGSHWGENHSGHGEAGRWDHNHPRREEVNNRLAHQDHRINQERREGEISGREAHQLHREDHQIRREERYMAAQNGGHISRGEQQVLNQQENNVSRQIGR
jgi:hypothetical protein